MKVIMKKTILYSLAVMASLTLASCNGDYEDWASPQSYSAEATAEKYGVTFAAGPEATSTLPDEDGIIQLVQLSSSNAAVTGYTVKSLTVNGEAIDGNIEGNYVTVKASDLQKIIENKYNSRAAVAREFDVVTMVAANLKNGDAVTVDVAGETKGSLTPYATPAKDKKGYYLLGDFQNVGWNLGTPLYMTDNGDGTYKATVVTNGEGDNWFKFYCGSNYSKTDWDEVNKGQMGCATNGDNARSNFLVYTGDPEYADGVQTPVISGQGQFEITLDMNNLTYKITAAESKFYVVGTFQNWSTENKTCMFYGEGNNVYSYTAKWGGAWDLKVWDEKGFGNWAVAYGTSVDGAGDANGSLINNDSKSFQAPTKDEYYTLTIDMNTFKYSWKKCENQKPTEYKNVSLIGEFNNWNGDVDLTQIAGAPHNWYVKATVTAGALKFRANHDWATSWGTSEKGTPIGDSYHLKTGGDNITVPAGTYEFYLNDITGQFNIVAVK